MSDIDGVNIAAAKALEARTAAMNVELKKKDAEIATLRTKSAELEARLARLETLVAGKK
jgi:ubiquinone biosynthesis protein UbiJ